VLVDGANGASFVFDQATGAVVSTFEFPQEVDRSPAYADGVAFGGTDTGQFYAVDLTTGAAVWQIETDLAQTSTPAVVNGLVLVSIWHADNTGSLLALDAASGEQVWAYTSSSGLGFSAPSVASGLVVAGGFDGQVYAVNLGDGTLVWSHALESGAGISSAPGIAAGVVYAGAESGEIVALDLASGTQLWAAAVANAITFGPIVDDSMLWVSTNLGEVHAFGVIASTQVTPTSAASPEANVPQVSAELIWKVTGSDAGLNTPLSAAVAPNGDVYVVDGFNDRIQIYSPDGNLVENWGELGTGPGQFQFHTMEVFVFGAVDFDADGNIYVFDSINNRVQKFDSDRNFITEWGSEGSGNGQFDRPVGLVDAVNELVYVLDYRNNRVQVFDLEGNFQDRWGGPGSRDGQFTGPVGADVDAEGILYVLDESGRPPLMFDRNGTFVGYFGDRPGGLTVGDDGLVYLSVQGEPIRVYSPGGTLKMTITEPEAYGSACFPYFASIQEDGTVYAIAGPCGPNDTDPERSLLLRLQLPKIPANP
jgi:outer membrane protein assembly factor BamB